MSKTFRIGMAGIVTAAAAVAGLMGAQPALAVGECDAGAFCPYVSGSFDPAYAHFEAQGNNGNWGSQFSSVSNKENSVKNRSTQNNKVDVYDQTYGVDFHYCVRPGASVVLPSDKDNDGESHYFRSYISGCY